MPQIPTYTAPEQDTQLRIPEGGAQTLSQGARRLGTMGNEAAQSIEKGTRELEVGVGAVGKKLEEEQTQSEVSKAPLLIAQDQSSRLNDLNQMAMMTLPGDITGKIGQYVNENMSAAKDAYMSNFTTDRAKEHAESLWDKHLANIYDHASAISNQASLDQNHNNLVQAVNTFASTAGDHPSTLDANLSLIDDTVDAQLKSLPAHQRETFDTTFRNEAKAQALGSALKTMAFGSADGSIAPNPEAAKTLLDSGKYDDVIGKHKDTFGQIVSLGEHQAKQDATTNAANADRAAQQRSDLTTSQYINNITAPNLGLRVLHDDNVLPEDKAALIGASNRMAQGTPPVTNAATMDHMITRLTSQDRPSSAQLLNQVSAGNLSLGDAQFLMGQDPNSPALHQLNSTLAEGKSALARNSGSGVVSPAGQQAYQRFQQFAVNAYKSGEPIDAKAMPDVLARFQPTAADAANAIPPSARPGGRLVPGGALSAPPTERQLSALAQPESGDRNIPGPMTSSGQAEGHYQITTGTWREFAARAGVDLALFPSAIAAPKPIQTQVAKTIPLNRWDPKTIRYLATRGLISGG